MKKISEITDEITNSMSGGMLTPASYDLMRTTSTFSFFVKKIYKEAFGEKTPSSVQKKAAERVREVAMDCCRERFMMDISAYIYSKKSQEEKNSIFNNATNLRCKDAAIYLKSNWKY